MLDETDRVDWSTEVLAVRDDLLCLVKQTSTRAGSDLMLTSENPQIRTAIIIGAWIRQRCHSVPRS